MIHIGPLSYTVVDKFEKSKNVLLINTLLDIL